MSTSSQRDRECMDLFLLLYQGAAYTASKHGVVGLSKNIAATYQKEGIRCVCFLPGGMATSIMANIGSDPLLNTKMFEKTGNIAQSCGADLVDVDDVAQTVLFYSSPAAKMCNGALVSVDGGWLAS